MKACCRKVIVTASQLRGHLELRLRLGFVSSRDGRHVTGEENRTVLRLDEAEQRADGRWRKRWVKRKGRNPHVFPEQEESSMVTRTVSVVALSSKSSTLFPGQNSNIRFVLVKLHYSSDRGHNNADGNNESQKGRQLKFPTARQAPPACRGPVDHSPKGSGIRWLGVTTPDGIFPSYQPGSTF